MIYQRISLTTSDPVGDPGPLPFSVANWKPEQVLDLSHLDAAYGLSDAGFWPVVDDIPDYDPATETVIAGDLTKDAQGKRFVREWTVEVIPITRAKVDAERDRRVATTFKFGGKLFQLDDRSVSRITAMGADARFAIAAGAQEGNYLWADPDNPFGFIATDNSVLPMDAQTMRDFANAAKLWVSRHTFAGLKLKSMPEIPVDFADDSHWPAAE